jgi:hypothetical protein
MKKIIPLALLILLQFSFTADEPSIKWSENYILTWNDFRGTPHHASPVAAITASGITYQLSALLKNEKVEVDCNVEAHFYPEKSWYKKESANSLILAHEQLHFDITELYARKLRQAIEKAVFTENVKQEVKALYDDINKALIAFQDSYDNATDYSRNAEKQQEWGKKIAEELKKLR